MFEFELDNNQQTALFAWLEEHNKTCKFFDDGTKVSPPGGAIGGRLTYCFTDTSLGQIAIVKCACGAEINLTDFDSW